MKLLDLSLNIIKNDSCFFCGERTYQLALNFYGVECSKCKLQYNIETEIYNFNGQLNLSKDDIIRIYKLKAFL